MEAYSESLNPSRGNGITTVADPGDLYNPFQPITPLPVYHSPGLLQIDKHPKGLMSRLQTQTPLTSFNISRNIYIIDYSLQINTK